MDEGRCRPITSSQTAIHVTIIALTISLALVACGRRLHQEETSEPGGPPATAATPAAPGRPLADSAFRVRWGRHSVPATVGAGVPLSVAVNVTNAGDTTWPDPATADPAQTGAYAVRLSYRWLNETGDTPAQDYQDRVELPKPLGPGESVTLTVPVSVPAKPGRYRLQFDLVQELVAWFEGRGADKLIVPLTVQ